MKPAQLRGLLPYIPRFRDKTCILAVDGAVVTDDNFPNLLLHIAVLRSLNIRIVLVHGAAKQIADLAAERGVTASDFDGAGITGPTPLRDGVPELACTETAAGDRDPHLRPGELAMHEAPP